MVGLSIWTLFNPYVIPIEAPNNNIAIPYTAIIRYSLDL